MFLLVTIFHLLPPDVLNVMGQVSDVVSDMSPEFIRGIEHVLFTIILN